MRDENIVDELDLDDDDNENGESLQHKPLTNAIISHRLTLPADKSHNATANRQLPQHVANEQPQGRSNNRTRKWTKEEDEQMVRLVAEMGIKRWGDIGKCLIGRTGKQCRERWHNQLDPSINKKPWTEEEEQLLLRLHDQFGTWPHLDAQIVTNT